MKSLLSLATVLVAIAAHAAVPSAERLLPADTLGLLTVADWSVTRSNFNRSALGQFFADPSMKPFADKLASNFVSDKAGSLEKELGIKLSDYSDLVRAVHLRADAERLGWFA